jgi:radical SAM superfamily enzyme YgiQ (UPF0313 family)
MEDVHAAMERKPPLGILSLGTYLKTHTDYDVKLLDYQLEALQENDFVQLLRDYKPNVVGISVVSFQLQSAYKLTQVVKAILPAAHICWGGPHLSIYPRESLNLEGVDSILLGDGEIPFTKLCQHILDNSNVEDIQGIYTKRNMPANDELFHEYVLDDLNELPILDLTLLPYNKYRAFLTNNLMATAITARGCPHRCIFCKLDFYKVRTLSIDKVIAQVEHYLGLGVNEIEFYDETFNLNTNRVIEFATKIVDKGFKFKWSFRGRVNAVNKEMLEAIKEAGCQRIQYGVEAGSERILKILKKGTNVNLIKKCFQLTNQYKIDTVAYFILGNPEETLEEMNATIKLAREIKPSYLEYSIFNISPGTESYNMALEQGVIDRDYWREYATNPVGEMPILVWTKDHTYEELEAIRKKALKNFYMNPSYIIKKALDIRPKEALQVCKTGYRLLKSLI